MARTEITSDMLIIRMEGDDKRWALKSELQIPRAHVLGAEPTEAEAREWFHGIRLGATHVSGVISAGRFYEHGQRVFWDVQDPQRAIAINLQNDRYSKLVIEVEDPAAALAAITTPESATP